MEQKNHTAESIMELVKQLPIVEREKLLDQLHDAFRCVIFLFHVRVTK